MRFFSAIRATRYAPRAARVQRSESRSIPRQTNPKPRESGSHSAAAAPANSATTPRPRHPRAVRDSALNPAQLECCPVRDFSRPQNRRISRSHPLFREQVPATERDRQRHAKPERARRQARERPADSTRSARPAASAQPRSRSPPTPRALPGREFTARRPPRFRLRPRLGEFHSAKRIPTAAKKSAGRPYVLLPAAAHASTGRAPIRLSQKTRR